MGFFGDWIGAFFGAWWGRVVAPAPTPSARTSYKRAVRPGRGGARKR